MGKIILKILGIEGSLLTTSAISAVLKIANMGLSFVVVVLLARLLGAEGYGIYTLAFVFCSVLSIIVQFGFPNLIVRETAQAKKLSSWGYLNLVWSWVDRCALQLSLLIVILAVGCVLLYFDDRISKGSVTALISLALLPILSFDSIKSAALRGLGHITIGQLSNLVVRPLLFLFFILAALVLLNDHSPAVIMSLHVLSAFFALCITVHFFCRYRPKSVNKTSSVDVSECKGWLVAAASMAFTAGMTQITNYADLLILGYFHPAESVGEYRVAVQIATLVVFGLRVVSVVSAPRFAREKGELEQLKRLSVVTARMSLMVALLASTIIYLWGEILLIKAFGAEYETAFQPLKVLVLGQLVNAFFGPIGVIMPMLGMERIAAKIMLAAALVNVGLNFLLIPIYGPIGAAFSTVVSILLWNLTMWWKLKLETDVRADPLGTLN